MRLEAPLVVVHDEKIAHALSGSCFNQVTMAKARATEREPTRSRSRAAASAHAGLLVELNGFDRSGGRRAARTRTDRERNGVLLHTVRKSHKALPVLVVLQQGLKL